MLGIIEVHVVVDVGSKVISRLGGLEGFDGVYRMTDCRVSIGELHFDTRCRIGWLVERRWL
jgi:hypothetical protein